MSAIYEKLKIDGLVDTHAHINSKKFDEDRSQVVERAKTKGVQQIFDVSVSVTSSHLSLDIASRNNGFIQSWIGIDPETFIPRSEEYLEQEVEDSWFDEQGELLKKLIETHQEYVIGVGETGLDYAWPENKFHDQEASLELVEKSKNYQQKMFRVHLQLAKDFDLPMTIHSRGAEKDCLHIAKSYKGATGIFHSYTGEYGIAKKILDHGFGLGVNGIATFRSAYELQHMYSKIIGKVSSDWAPEDFYKKGIFFETDSPYLAPEGKRGERNEPANVKDVFEQFVQLLSNI